MHNRTRFLARVVAIAAIASSYGFGAREAWGAHQVNGTSSCGTWNWCAPSQGGAANCDDCCNQQSGGDDGGLCYDDRELDNFVGCLCY
jgi:hypothetical protein